MTANEDRKIVLKFDLNAVKKSKTGICHKAGSRYYDQTKYYKKFTTIEDCIKSRGRLPKRR